MVVKLLIGLVVLVEASHMHDCRQTDRRTGRHCHCLKHPSHFVAWGLIDSYKDDKYEIMCEL